MPSEENFDMMKWEAAGRGEGREGERDEKKGGEGERERERCQRAVKIARHSKLFSKGTRRSLNLLLRNVTVSSTSSDPAIS